MDSGKSYVDLMWILGNAESAFTHKKYLCESMDIELSNAAKIIKIGSRSSENGR